MADKTLQCMTFEGAEASVYFRAAPSRESVGLLIEVLQLSLPAFPTQEEMAAKKTADTKPCQFCGGRH